LPRAVIAEDEALLRDDLIGQLKGAWPGLDIVAACEDGGSALEAIAEHRPEVAFLDIRMPGLTGLEVAHAAAEASPATQVVFVTAYDQYALEAFDRGAIDYLLKPLAPDRLAATVKRVQARLASGPADPQALARILDELRAKLPAAPARTPPLAWLTATVGRETRLIQLEDVVYFQADNKYTVVVTKEGEAVVRTPIRELLDALDPDRFRQVHRSTIVNLRMVASVVRDDSGRGTMRLKGRSETLPVSLTYMPLFKSL
jgi:DNA-binding LytR/AlgR family response regulator